MHTNPFSLIITFLLILLWLYAAFSKLFNFSKFKQEMSLQVFPPWIGKIFVFLVPFTELLAVILLIVYPFHLTGLYLSFFMLLLFTLYVGGAVFKIYERVPCACGGLFARLNWKMHFRLNIFLSLLALAGILLHVYAKT